jgi:polar amino acid transport system permease protein
MQFFFAYEAWCCCRARGSNPLLVTTLTVETQWMTRAWAGALFVLFLNTAAYSAEIFHGALKSVPKGDLEAADAYGLTGWARFRRITGPPCCGWPGPAIPTRRSFCSTPRRWCSFRLSRLAAMGDALYYARYFADQTFNPFVAYPIIAAYFVLLTLGIIGLFGARQPAAEPAFAKRGAAQRSVFRPQYIR